MEAKKLEDITRKEWIAYRWAEIEPTFGSEERIFRPNGRRTPEEAFQAMEEWEMTAEERDCEPESDPEKGMVQ